MLAYAAGNSLRVRLYLKPVSGGRAVPLTSEPAPDRIRPAAAAERGELERGLPGSQQEPRWSPTGNSILFRAGGGVDTIAVGLGGGTPVTVISGAQGPVASAHSAPDGRK